MDQKALLAESARIFDITLDNTQTEKFLIFKDLLLQWNEKVNLTAITQEKEIIIKHFLDSISLVPYLKNNQTCSVIDVGTGAGFPGIPVKIACPDISLTLLDSLKKRVVFLEHTIKKLQFENVMCIHSRAEDAGQNSMFREKYNYSISRAVAHLSVLSEYCLPFVKLGGYFISLKGPDVSLECEQAQNAIEKCGGKISRIEKISIPQSDITHSIVLIEKINKTPENYPRKAGKINKNPL